MNSNRSQSRHPKGSRQGGQWKSKPVPALIKGDELALGDTPAFQVPDKIKMKVFGKQRLLRHKDGVWPIPATYATTVSRKMVAEQGTTYPLESEAMDIAQLVLAELLEKGLIFDSQEYIDRVTRIAIRGAYDIAYAEADKSGYSYLPVVSTALNWHRLKRTKNVRFELVEAAAELRGMHIGDECKLFRSERLSPEKEQKMRQENIAQALWCMNKLTPVYEDESNAHIKHVAALQHLFQLEIPDPRYPNHTVLDYLEGLSPTAGYTTRGFLAGAWFYILGAMDDDELKGKALHNLDIMMTEPDDWYKRIMASEVETMIDGYFRQGYVALARGISAKTDKTFYKNFHDAILSHKKDSPTRIHAEAYIKKLASKQQ